MFQKKYYYTFRDINDVQHTVEFWKNTGEVIYAEEIRADSNPFIVNYPVTDTKYQTVRGSGCEINILSTNSMKFIDLYTTSMLEMQIRLFRGSDMIWIGYLDSELYSEPFDQYDNYPVSLTGNDGLALLERIDFLTSYGTKYELFKSNWDIIIEILKKLNIEWNNIYVGLSTVSYEVPYSANTTIFSDTYSLCENFYDEDGKPMSCREVLENILLLFSSYIQIINGNVYITDLNTLCLYPVLDPTPTIQIYGVGVCTNNIKFYFNEGYGDTYITTITSGTTDLLYNLVRGTSINFGVKNITDNEISFGVYYSADGHNDIYFSSGCGVSSGGGGYNVPTGFTYNKITLIALTGDSCSLYICNPPTTTTTTTLSPSCYIISDKLKWSALTGQTSCQEVLTDTYYGNSSNFALTTTISANAYCTVTLGGYYSNGYIWKYTSDGLNFTSSGICSGIVTTTTTTVIESNNWVYFDRIDGLNAIMSSNITGGTVVITYDYFISASCDNVGTDGQDSNSSTSYLYISEDSGYTWTTVTNANAYVSGGNFPYSQADDQHNSGTTTVTTTNVNAIVFSGQVECDSGRNGKSGGMQVTLKSATISGSPIKINCANIFNYDCSTINISCDQIVTTNTTTFYNPPIIYTPPFRKYDSGFTYLENVDLDLELGDVSTIGFASDVQTLNILSPINKQKITWSPYINNKILDYEASSDNFWSLYTTTYNGLYPNNWIEKTYLSAGLTGSTDPNYYQTWMPHFWFSGYFCEAIGQANNEGTFEKYLKIDRGFLDTIDSPKHFWVGTLPSVIGNPDMYYLKIEASALPRTKDTMGGPASATDIRRLALSTNLKIGDRYYAGVTLGWVTGYTNYIWNFTDFTKNTTTSLYESQNISDKYTNLVTDRIYSVEPPKVLYIPLWGFIGHDIHLQINSYDAFGSTGTNITSSVLDVRLNKFKITLVDVNKVDVPNLDIDYISYVDKNIKNDGNDLVLKLGTNLDTSNSSKSFIPTAKGSIFKKVTPTSYNFISNFNRNNKTDILENLLARTIVSNYTNKTIEITCTTNKINNIFGILRYNNYWPNKKFGLQGAILDYHEDTMEIVLQEINVDNLDIKKNY